MAKKPAVKSSETKSPPSAVSAVGKTTPVIESAGEEYTVVARRYRPQQFTELIGQQAAASALINAINTNRVAHAYLFTGARGVGKTSAARILAKALNCEKGPTATPCDQCDICSAIAAGSDIDVQEIDGASNRKIEEIRQIRQNVTTRPSRARYKIYIIDEVHMLTNEAFNALLKTLEEPPAHVKFIFATTEVQKIPITILSRCQRFDFGTIRIGDLVDQLRAVVAREKREVSDDALKLVARRAAGSMRDAQSLLEQILASTSSAVAAADVHRLLGTAADDRIVAVAGAVLNGDAKSALELVEKCADDGLQLGELLDQLIEYWRGLMLMKCAGEIVGDWAVGDEHREAVKAQADRRSLDTVMAGLDVLSAAKSRLRFTAHGRIVLETTLVRMSRLDELQSVTELAERLASGVVAGGDRLSASGPPATNDPSKKNHLNGNKAPGTIGTATSTGPAEPGQRRTITADSVPAVWTDLRKELGIMFSAELEKAGPPILNGGRSLLLRFPGRHSRAYEYCRDSGRQNSLESHLERITGEKWALRMELDSAAADPEPTRPASMTAREREQMLLKIPLIEAIVNRLDGAMQETHADFGKPAVSTDDSSTAPRTVAADSDDFDETLGEDSGPDDNDDGI